MREDMSDWYRPRSFTRRHVLFIGAALGALAALVPPVFRPAMARAVDDEFVIVNGWVLKREDLLPR
jgi:hypothetical protein